MVNNGFPNPCLKYSHLINPVALEVTCKSSNKYFTYHEKDDGGYYSRNDFFACNKVLIANRVLWQTDNEEDYIGQVHIYTKNNNIHSITLCFLNGDIKHLSKFENNYIAKNKISLTIKTYLENSGVYQKYTININTVGSMKFINYKTNSVYLFKRIYESGELIWNSKSYSESGKFVSVCVLDHEKYMAILLTNYNYLLFHYDNGWKNITAEMLNLSNFMLIFNINSGFKKFKNVKIDYETDLTNLEYSLLFKFEPEFDQILDLSKPKCLTYNLLTNEFFLLLCNGNKIPIDTNKAMIKIPINAVNYHLFPSKSFSEFTFKTASSGISITNSVNSKDSGITSINSVNSTSSGITSINSLNSRDNGITSINSLNSTGSGITSINSVNATDGSDGDKNCVSEDQYLSISGSEDGSEDKSVSYLTNDEVIKALSQVIQY